jgi:hypothetical protein
MAQLPSSLVVDALMPVLAMKQPTPDHHGLRNAVSAIVAQMPDPAMNTTHQKPSLQLNGSKIGPIAR